ncbi:MAG: transposase domain-containing protein [Burkholderiales bacterium]|nr:transposase domain-containing protein [Burkholderiales bacterium]
MIEDLLPSSGGPLRWWGGHRVEPYLWLRCELRDLPAAKTVDEVKALLPWNLNMQALTI